MFKARRKKHAFGEIFKFKGDAGCVPQNKKNIVPKSNANNLADVEYKLNKYLLVGVFKIRIRKLKIFPKSSLH